MALLTVAASAISAVATAGYAALVGPISSAVEVALKGAVAHGAAPQTSDGFESRWLVWIFSLISIGLVRSGAEFGRAFWGTRLQQSAVRELRQRLLGHLLALPPVTLGARPVGELASRLQVEIHGVRSMLHLGVSAGLGSLLMATALATLAWQVDSQLATVGLIALPLGIVALFAIGHPTRRLQRKLFASESQLVGASAAAIRGVEVLQSFEAEGAFSERMDTLAAESARRATTTEAWRALNGPAAELSAALGVALALSLAFAREGPIDVAATATVVAALVLMFRPLRTLGGALLGFWTGYACLDRLDELWQLGEPAPDKPPRAKEAVVEVRVDGVAASYDGRPVLADISVALQPGQFVAVTGESGAGKTTLLRLIAGLLEPVAGKLRIDGRVASMQDLRRSSTWMPQESWLFEGTVAENIALGAAAPDYARLERAVFRAAATNVVNWLGAGWQGAIMRDGRNLSAGQRQRICLARSFYRATPTMLFDEPTSALDKAREEHVVSSLRELARSGHMVIVATHRETVLAAADRVLRVEDHGLTEVGEEPCAPLLH